MLSGTKFHSSAMTPREALAFLFLWQEAAEGISSREMAGYLQRDYRAMHVQIMKVREALLQAQDPTPLDGIVEADAAYFNRHIRPPNRGTGTSFKQKKKDATAGEDTSEAAPSERQKYEHNPDMYALVAFVQRRTTGGIARIRTAVVKTENQVDVDRLAQQYVAPTATVYTDESGAYTPIIATAADHKRVKHKAMFVDPDGHHTNNVECFFGEMRRAQGGAFHRFGLGYIQYYAVEIAWRLEMRDKPNDVRLADLTQRVLRSGRATQFADMWNKRPKAGKPKVEKPANKALAFPVPAGSLKTAQPAPARPAYRKKRTPRSMPRAARPGEAGGT